MIEREEAQLVAVDVVPPDDLRTKAAPLTGELLMRGRSRAHDLIRPPRTTALRPPMPPGAAQDTLPEGSSAIEDGRGLRDAGLLLIWVAVFFGTFLIGLSLID